MTYYIVKVQYPILEVPRYLDKDEHGWYTTSLENCIDFSSQEQAEESRKAFLTHIAQEGVTDVTAEVIDGGNQPFNPNWVTIPGDHIREQLEALAMTVETFAERAGLSMEVVLPLLEGVLEIDDELAQKIATQVGTSKQFWLNLERIYRDGLAKGLHVSGRTS